MSLGSTNLDLQDQNVVVTGAAGFIGSHLVDALLKEGVQKVIAVDNFFLGSERNLQEAAKTCRLEICRIDATDLAGMEDLVESHCVETLFDLAVVPLPTSLSFPDYTIKTNTQITTTACELARRNKIAKLVHFSSSEVYGTARYIPMDENHPHDSITPYAASKSAGDQIVDSYVRTFGVNAITIRPFNNFGPRQNSRSYAGIIPTILRKVANGEPIQIHGTGEQARDFIFVKDTVNETLKITKKNKVRGDVVNLGSGYPVTVNELVSKILQVLGKPKYPVVYTQERRGDVHMHCADPGKAQRLYDYSPKPISEDDLRETVSWYQEEMQCA